MTAKHPSSVLYYSDILKDERKHRHGQQIKFTLSYGNGASCRLDKQSLQDAPASLQVRQENKIAR